MKKEYIKPNSKMYAITIKANLLNGSLGGGEETTNEKGGWVPTGSEGGFSKGANIDWDINDED